MASSLWKTAVAPAPKPQQSTRDSTATDSPTAATPTKINTAKIICLKEEDGETLLLLLNILHFRHHAIPVYLPLDKLVRLGRVARSIHCSQAISSSTTPWFDRIFTETELSPTKSPEETMKAIYAAWMCNEAMYFARFTSRYVRSFTFSDKVLIAVTSAALAATGLDHPSARRIETAIYQRQKEVSATLRLHLDLVVEPCAVALGKESHHYIDCEPETEPEPGDNLPDNPAVVCAVDSQAAPIYLGALRDAKLWPPTAFGAKTADQVVEMIEEFRVPDYDDCDKCDFCIPLVKMFATSLNVVRKTHREMLWGLCLDCFNAGGMNPGECRFPHGKGSKA